MPTLDWLNRAEVFDPFGCRRPPTSREKRLVGERWAQTTGHRFVMVEKALNGMDMAAQIRAAVRS